jgi:EAL and modified HD-GYP domain-containing signal transduction protein
MNQFPLIRLHPIVDARHGWAAVLLDAPVLPDSAALARLFGEFGLFEALGPLPCVLERDNSHCGEEIDSLVPTEQVVLKLPAATCVASPDCSAIDCLRSLGFRLMADGLPPAGSEFCPGVDAVALHCGEETDIGALARKAGVRCLALGVDTPARFDACRQAGCHWFAGNYALHMPAGRDTQGAGRHALLLQLLTLISRDAESREIEAVIKHDAHLSYQLLRLVNSVAFALTQKITSFGQAITLLGRRQLQRWLQLLLYARPEGTGRSPLLPRAALRAALMEALAAARDRDVQDRAFMAGMFSLLDVLTGSDMAGIIQPLNLADDVSRALLERGGPLGPMLAAVEACDATDPAEHASALDAAGIDNAAWAVALVRGYRWAVQVSQEA